MLKSIIGYQGNKLKLAPFLFGHMPPKINTFYDVFGGSATMSINAVSRSKKVIYNDHDTHLTDMWKFMRNTTPAKIEAGLDFYIKKWNLAKPLIPARTSVEDRKTIFAPVSENYFAFRDHVNLKIPGDPFKLWVLSRHSFCGLLRFSTSKGNMNYGYGERSYPPSAERTRDITNFCKAIEHIKFSNRSWFDFCEMIIQRAKEGDVVYFDPPYIASGANVYKGTWTELDEVTLLSVIDSLHLCGIKFMLSNVLSHRNSVNNILRDWIAIHPEYRTERVTIKGKEIYKMNQMQANETQNTVEVMVTNLRERKCLIK